MKKVFLWVILLAVVLTCCATTKSVKPTIQNSKSLQAPSEVEVKLISGEIIKGALIELSSEHITVDRGGYRSPFYIPKVRIPLCDIVGICLSGETVFLPPNESSLLQGCYTRIGSQVPSGQIEKPYLHSSKVTQYERSVAEYHLELLAKKAWAENALPIGCGCISGPVFIAAGITMLSDKDVENWEYGIVPLGIGLIFSTSAVWDVSDVSRAQQELKNLLRIDDIVERERVGHEALVSLARSSRKRKSLKGLAGFAGSISFMYLLYKEQSERTTANYAIGIVGVVGTLVYLSSKTLEEKTLENYLRGMERKKELGFQLGVDPYGRSRIALVYHF